MRAFWAAALLALIAPLGACASQAPAAGDSSAGDAAALAVIPVTVRTPSGTHVFQTEVAATPEQQSQGLMFRTELAADRAMIFPFASPRTASFWMKNTLIPLDMLFIRADGTIDRIAENTIPGSLEPVVSGGEVAAVLELAGGTSARLGIDEKAVVTWTQR